MPGFRGPGVRRSAARRGAAPGSLGRRFGTNDPWRARTRRQRDGGASATSQVPGRAQEAGHGPHPGRDHGRRGARLPRLQRPLPGRPRYEVVAFTATQIPGIANRRYPPLLAGRAYPGGIPIVPEAELERLIADERVDEVVFAYSDVSHETVMHAASRALAAGATFVLPGPDRTMIRARKPVLAVGATRTGAGKSQTTRFLAALLADQGITPVVVRHPMPYGDLVAQAVQRFATYEDLDRHETTIEEREEYEPHLDAGRVVYAGVDYEAILERAEAEADVILWDGGNNDFPFYRPDVFVVVADPLRAGDERRFHPGETNLRMADVVVVNKIDSAEPAAVDEVLASIRELNPRAEIVTARSDLTLVGGRSRAGASSSSRTARRSPTAAWPSGPGSWRPGGSVACSSTRGRRPSARSATCWTATPPSIRSCRRWAIPPRSCSTSRGRSMPSTRTSSCRPRRST